METYKVIKGFEGYSVSDHGNVKNNKTGRIKNVNANEKGYIQVSLSKEKKQYKKMVHVFVASAFIENPENKSFVDHIDNCKTNNIINNLRWATSVENSQNRNMMITNTSGVKGVSFDKSSNKWIATISIDGIRINLGRFDKKEDAIHVRITRANEAFGVFTNSCEKII